MMNCVAIDDEPLALSLIEKYIKGLPELRLQCSFTDAVSAIEWLRNNVVDLLFLDIQMPDIKGTSLYKSLPYKPMVIFTTAFKDYAAEGFELEAIDYLLKPFDFKRFQKAVTKANDYHNYLQSKEQESFIFIRSDYYIKKIMLEDILYIESVSDYVKIHLTAARPVLSLMTLKSISEKIPATRFLRVHRSYIVAISKIKQIAARKITLLNGTTLPVGDTYQETVSNFFKKGSSNRE